MCPPCMCLPRVRFGRASKPCAACVRRIRHVSAKCPPCVCFGHVSKPCSPCVCFGRASKPCPSCVGLYIRFGFPAKPRPPCVCQALCPPRLVSALCCLWPRLQAFLSCCTLCPPCVRSLSFLCSLVVRLLFALYPLFVGFWPVYGLALAGPLLALCLLFGFCVCVCSVSVVVRLSRGLCRCAFACCSSGHLYLAAPLSAPKLGRAFAPCLSFSPFVLISPNSLPWGSLLEKKAGRDMPWPLPQSLSALCPLCVRDASASCLPCVRLESLKPCLPCVRLAFCPPCVGHVSALCPPVSTLRLLWPRLQTLSPPCVRPCVRLWPHLQTLSAMRPPCLGLCPALCPLLAMPPNLVRHVSALPFVHCVSAKPLKPCLWTLSALGLLWGRAVASSGKILSYHCAFILRACLGFVCVGPCPDLYTELDHAVPLCGPGPRLNRLSLGLRWCMLTSVSSPNSLLWGPLLEEKRLAAICSESLFAGHVSAIVRLVSALVPLWPRLRTLSGVRRLSALCPPWVRLAALVRSCVCLVCVHHVLAWCLPPNLARQCTPYVRHVPATRHVCPPCAMCPLFVRHMPALYHHHVSSPLDFVRSWPAVGQGHGIMK